MHGVPLIQQNFDQTMAIQKISELNSAPIKSKFYLVPCIQVPAWVQGEFEGGYKRLDWVPILEPIHDDHELGFTIKHYNYDLRFSKILVGAATVIAVNEKMTKIRFPTEETEIVHQRKKCYHESPLSFRDNYRKIVRTLEVLNKDKRLENWICPHRGTSLKNCPVGAQDTSVICPVHGLKWCIRSGNLIKLEK
jgi:Rieske [2Fe-2S] domain